LVTHVKENIGAVAPKACTPASREKIGLSGQPRILDFSRRRRFQTPETLL